MSSESADEGEVPHYSYLVLITFPPFPTEIEVICHHAKTNDIFLSGGRVGPSSFTKMNEVEIFLLERLILQIGFILPVDLLSTMHLYWERTLIEHNFEIKYSLYVAGVGLK